MISNYRKITIALLYMVTVVVYIKFAFVSLDNYIFLIFASLFGIYMAMNIGANDVSNNVSPAVGSGAVTLKDAIIIAAIFEVAGALIAGGDVLHTIKSDIIDPSYFGDPSTFIYVMSAALLSSALWLHFATWLKAPVSTTHSIVGGVLGAGVAAAGVGIVSWGTMGKITASWILSPIMGGLIAAGFLYVIKSQILYQKDRIDAAKRVIPILLSIMVWAFVSYILLKALKHLIVLDLSFIILMGLVVASIAYFFIRPVVIAKLSTFSDTREDLSRVFTYPLIFAMAILSFAHGSNDVANAVGPLAGIYDTLVKMEISIATTIPLWIMVIGALGIALGLILFGPRLIQTVGSEITELDQLRAFAIMIASAITVIVASSMGLPVSSTHIAVGAIFGVGFLREWLDSRGSSKDRVRLQEEIESYHYIKGRLKELKHSRDYETKYQLSKDIQVQKRIIKELKADISENYIKRDLFKKIVFAWVVTLPASALLSATIFYMIR
jgi:PiT family inorganic phosphate transporter